MKLFATGFSSLLIFLILSFCGSLSFAFDVPARPDNYVNDYAHLLSPEAADRLNQKLADFEKSSSNQLVIVTIPTLDNQPIEDYSIHLAERWKIGTHEHNNGIILLVSLLEHKVRIEVGYGLEGALPDAIAEQIIQDEINPSMRLHKFDDGIEHGADAIILATKNEYHSSQSTSSTDRISTVLSLIITFIILSIFLLKIISVIRAVLLYCFGLSSHIHTPFWDAVAAGSFGGSTSSGGGGGGGGFSGGGGGSFGGGGASGSW